MLRINLLKKRRILVERFAITLAHIAKYWEQMHAGLAKPWVVVLLCAGVSVGSFVLYRVQSPKQSVALATQPRVAQTPLEATSKPNGPPPGTVTIDSDQIKLREALQQIVAVSHHNLLIAAPVKGSVAVHVHTQPWRDALNAVATAFQLVVQEQAHTFFITTRAQRTKEQLQQQQLQTKAQQLKPLQRAFIKVQHVTANYIAQFIKRQRNRLLGMRGAIDVDERGNALWLEATPAHLTQLQTLIKALDHPLQQLLIKVRVVSVEKTTAKQLGLVLHAHRDTTQLESRAMRSTVQPMITTLMQGAVTHWQLPWLHWAHNAPIDLTLAALQQTGRARVVASPQVITTDHHMAQISSGEEIPYQHQGANGGSLVRFKKAVLGLKVTPDISANHKIHLDLQINQDRMSSRQVQGIPAIATRSIHTQVLLENGATVVIGGIDEHDQIGSVTQVPGWSHLPVIGRLFKHHQQQHNHTELLLFVTPTIL